MMNEVICRICGSDGDLVHISEGGQDLLEKLEICANVKIDYTDDLPKHICSVCRQGVDFSHRLRKQSEATEKRLRQQQLAKKGEMQNSDVANKDEAENDESECESGSIQNTTPAIGIPTNDEDVLQDSNIFYAVADVGEIAYANILYPLTNTTLQTSLVEQEEVDVIVEENQTSTDILWTANATESLAMAVVEIDKNNERMVHASDDAAIDHIAMEEQSLSMDVIEYNDADDVLAPDENHTFENYIEYQDADGSSNNIELCYSVNLVRADEVEDDHDDDKRCNESIARPCNDTVKEQLGMKYKCDTCSESFYELANYRVHVKNHGKERFLCIQCNKWFQTRYRLHQHARIHFDDVVKHLCPECGNRYRHRHNLVRHIRTTHNMEKLFHCNICLEFFNRSDVLKNHMTRHTVERNYHCDICEKKYKSLSSLLSHKKIHETSTKSFENSEKSVAAAETPKGDDTARKKNKRSYHCAQCGKISLHRFAHKNHMLTHTNERPYACNHCSKCFRTLAAKVIHERIHLNVRPYKCDQCAHSFRQAAHLKDHKLIHDGVLSYLCTVCSMAFAKKGNLKVHMRKHTGDRPYKCTQTACAQRFTVTSQLKRHLLLAHNIDGRRKSDEDNIENTAAELTSTLASVDEQDERTSENHLDVVGNGTEDNTNEFPINDDRQDYNIYILKETTIYN